jgi:acyl-CoA hydrolase/GNAT superfamily N-acetyltransferase
MDTDMRNNDLLDDMRKRYPEKFSTEEEIFSNIHRGDRIFIATGCAEPQYLVRSLIAYVESNPKAFFDAEVIHIWTLGVAPYTEEQFKRNFRHNSFFISHNTRQAVNLGAADYTPISLSDITDLFYHGLVPLDVALIQTTPPDSHGYMNLGVSVDIVKAATEVSRLVIAQVNSHMPKVPGDGFIHLEEVNYLIPYDEPILEYHTQAEPEIAARVGKYLSQLIQDGDTIQVGFGDILDAVLPSLGEKKNLGIHTEFLSHGIVELMKKGVVNNSKKTLNRGKTVATFCMGTKETYEYIHDNPSIELKTVDYTNQPLVIARQRHMTAINTALSIELTGQTTSDSLGMQFYSGVGGQANFMRGAALAPHGKTILILPSTAQQGKHSRIVPYLPEGSGATLNRCDVQYVATEYGLVYLHGKNIRERAMALISIAHPKFRPWLIEEAKKRNLIYKDQAFIPGKRGEYPEQLEIYRTTTKGLEVLLRPVKISDEDLLKDFFYSLSDQSLYRRFLSQRKDMPHERLQEFVVIDYSKEMVILAVLPKGERELIVGIGQYSILEPSNTAEVAFAVRDEYHNREIGTELLKYLTNLAKRQGLHGFTAEVLLENKPMIHVFDKMGFTMHRTVSSGVYELRMTFRGNLE